MCPKPLSTVSSASLMLTFSDTRSTTVAATSLSTATSDSLMLTFSQTTSTTVAATSLSTATSGAVLLCSQGFLDSERMLLLLS